MICEAFSAVTHSFLHSQSPRLSHAHVLPARCQHGTRRTPEGEEEVSPNPEMLCAQATALGQGPPTWEPPGLLWEEREAGQARSRWRCCRRTPGFRDALASSAGWAEVRVRVRRRQTESLTLHVNPLGQLSGVTTVFMALLCSPA